jgi:hypothetical protein
MTLTRLLTFQIIYALMGLGYNVVSYFLALAGKEQLSATDPVTGAIVMVVYALFLVPGMLRYVIPYRILMVIAIVVFGYGGIYAHIANFIDSGFSLYSSPLAWVLAVGINVFGLVFNVIAALGWFRK